VFGKSIDPEPPPFDKSKMAEWGLVYSGGLPLAPSFVARGEVWHTAVILNNSPWYAFFDGGTNYLVVLEYDYSVGYWVKTSLEKLSHYALYPLL